VLLKCSVIADETILNARDVVAFDLIRDIQPCGRSARVWVLVGVCGCGCSSPKQHLDNSRTLDHIIQVLVRSSSQHGLQDHQEDPGGGPRGPEC